MSEIYLNCPWHQCGLKATPHTDHFTTVCKCCGMPFEVQIEDGLAYTKPVSPFMSRFSRLTGLSFLLP